MSNNTEPRDTSAVGKNHSSTNAIGYAMRFLTRVTGSEFAQKYNLSEPINRVAYQSTKTGFKTLGAVTRSFDSKKGNTPDPARLANAEKRLFNLNPDEEQQMIADTVRDFASGILRPAAYDADAAATTPTEILSRAAELGICMINVPEEFDGAATENTIVTNFLVAEAMAYGDMGLALSLLAPAGVAKTLSQFGSASQQATYLPAFAGENIPQSAVVIAEPRALFDPFELKTKATRVASGYQLNGVKSFVPAAGSAELFIIGASLDGRGALFIVPADTKGLVVEADPSMGIRAAGLGRINLSNVTVPAAALLGEEEGETTANDYREIVRLSRLGWAALAAGTAQAVLDYVIPYVNEREAFGEPISNRQAVAFMVADMATELDSIRLVSLRAGSRAEQGKSYAREVALARKLVIDKGMKIGSDGVQLLGGHGFTKEHPVERWFRDLRAAGIGEGVVVL